MIGLFIGTALFLLGGLAELVTQRRWTGLTFAGSALLAQFFILPAAFQVLTAGNMLSLAVYFSFPIGMAYFRLDPLAAFFLVIISLGGLFTAVYSLGYMKLYRNSRYSSAGYYFFMGLLVFAMLLVVTVQNALLFLIVWEIMSLASFFLVTFEHDREEVRRVGLYYLVTMQISAAFLLTAFAWAATLTNSLDFADFGAVLRVPGSISAGLFLLFLIGFGCKAGFVPLHTWLPLAHPAAPTGVSALMSGVMIKTGIYGILRLILIGGVPNIALAYLIFGIALVSGVYGVMNAIVQHDLKKLLAYHSIENIGIIGIGIGLGMLGFAHHHYDIALFGFLGGLLHVFNHFTFKSLLFYGAGVVYAKTHTREIEKLGGLIHSLPATALLFLIASLAISGLPLFSGFMSEFAIYTGLVSSLATGSTISAAAVACGLTGLAFIGIQAVLCFTKVFSVCFLGMPRIPQNEQIRDDSAAMLAPMIILAVFIVLVGLCPLMVLPLLKSVIGQFLPHLTPGLWENMTALYARLGQAILALGGLILFFLALRWFILRGKEVTLFKTWDCGYQAANSRMSYTGSSFTAPFLHLVAPFIPHQIRVKRPEGLFPREAYFETHHDDFIAFYVLSPCNSLIRRMLALFTWIQSGRTQHYILYGLILLILLIIWIMVVA